MVQWVLGVLAFVGVATAGVVGAAVVLNAVPEDSTTTTVVTRVIDGDTVEINSGEQVRLIGVDTPERGTCGYEAATRAMRRMVEGREVSLVNPASVQDLDGYNRLLRFVDVGDRDSGFTQITSGRARARYDSRDGYDEHPRESRYHEADLAREGVCEKQRLRDERETLRAERQALRQQRKAFRAERWREARRFAEKADIRIRDGETANQVVRRAKAAISERRRLRELARQAPPPPPPPAPKLAPAPPAPPSGGFVPPSGWTTDALTPGYTGCRQGYPGGKINGVYVWKPIQC